jgi:ferredoxin-type protein NapF
LANDSFTEACTACGECVTACPENIIVNGSGGYPEIDFRQGACTFCNACIDTCADGALSHQAETALQIQLHVGENCLARRQVVCQTCGDACEANAIRFVPRIGVVAVPEIDQQNCTSCGACVAACPEYAMQVLANG